MLKIALPAENGILFGHFGGAPEFEVFTLGEDNKVINHETLNPPAHEHGTFPLWLQSLGINVVIASGIGVGAISHFDDMKITVMAGAELKKTDELIKDYCNKTLKLQPTACNHEHHSCH